MLDIKKFIDGLHDYISKAFAPVIERVRTLEERVAKADSEKLTLTEVKLVVEEAIDELPAPKDGKDGASVSLEEVLAAMPKPVDGKDGAPGRDAPDIDIITNALESMVKREVAAMPKPVDGKDGAPGKDVDVESIFTTVRGWLEEYFAKQPAVEHGKDGAPGKDGTSVTIDEVMERVTPIIQKHLDELPIPKDGIDGAPGSDGKDGTSVTMDDVQEALGPVIDNMIKDGLAAIPTPKDGAPGRDAPTIEEILAHVKVPTVEEIALLVPVPKNGKDGTNGRDAPTLEDVLAAIPIPKDGADGAPGKDGVSVTMEDVKGYLKTIMEESVASWALDFERRAMDLLQKTADRIPLPRDGKDGKDGVDGFNLEDFTPIYDGERTLTLRFERGDVKREWPLKLPMLLERGIFVNGKTYERGDCVTYGGSYWTCLVETTVARPGESKDWRLVARKGRDGKDGKDGERGPPGKPPLNGDGARK